KADFDGLEVTAIRELGAGRNSKLQLQFTKPVWNARGPWGIGTGTTYSDRGYQATWSPSRGQPGSHQIIDNYRGGGAISEIKSKTSCTFCHNGPLLSDQSVHCIG